MTIIVYKRVYDENTRTKARVYDDYCIQEQKLGYMTIIVYKKKN